MLSRSASSRARSASAAWSASGLHGQLGGAVADVDVVLEQLAGRGRGPRPGRSASRSASAAAASGSSGGGLARVPA